MRRLKFGLDPLISKKRDQRTIQAGVERHVDGIVRRGFFESVVQVVGREIVDVIFGAHHGVAKAKRAVGELDGNLPAVVGLAGAGMPIDEARVRAAIGCVNRRMYHPPHQVLAKDVVVDRRQRAACAQETRIGGAEAGIVSGGGLIAANQIDQTVVQQRKQRGQLRHDGVIVVARIGNQRLGERNAMPCNAAIYSGDIFSRRPRDVAERAARLDVLVFPAHAPEPQLGASVVIWSIERIYKRRAHGSASKQRFKLQRRAARVGGPGTEHSRNRKRDRGVNQIVGHELQQIGVARGNAGIFPTLQRRVRMRWPLYFGIHPPRQAVHQRADFRQVSRRAQRIDAVSLEALRRTRCAEKVPETGGRRVTANGNISRGFQRHERCLNSFLRSHRMFSPSCMCESETVGLLVKLS